MPKQDNTTITNYCDIPEPDYISYPPYQGNTNEAYSRMLGQYEVQLQMCNARINRVRSDIQDFKLKQD